MGKLGILLGGGIGYVLGSRAGRERYDQIERQARRVWKDPRVQQKKDEAQHLAREKGEQLKDRAADAGSPSSAGSSSGSDPAGGPSTVTPSDLPLAEPRPPLPTDPGAAEQGGTA